MMVKVPTSEEHARLWAGLTFKQRREILRAVNRGEAITSRKQARIAVGAARQQQRYWRWAWLLGPAAGLFLIPNWTAVAFNALLLGALMGGLAYWRYRRAQRAEYANLAVLDGRKSAKRVAPDLTATGGDARRWRWPWRRDT
jgi:hypothetical protein